MVTMEQIKELRNATGAGVNAVKEALEISGGNTEAAIKYLREKGVAKAEKRKDKIASNGILGVYKHTNSKLLAIVEVACETDFAAKSPDMAKFADEIALHVAAIGPKYISVDTIDPSELETEKKVFEADLEGKPEEVKAKIMEGKLSKFYKDTVLLKQSLFSDESKLVEDYLNELIAKIGEKIVITRFFKVQLGEEFLTDQVKL